MSFDTLIGLATVALAWALAGPAGILGATGAEAAGSPIGTWKITFTPKLQSGYEPTLKLKLEGEKLRGTLTHLIAGQVKEVAIEEGKLKGVELSFVTHAPARANRDGAPSAGEANATLNSKFQGKFGGDTIKGKVEDELMGQTRTRDWEAKRVKE